MGMVRFLLAMVVVVGHLGYYNRFGNARIAVQAFFMISGFLISFVLHKNAAYASPLRFYLNRALRIYPAYWLVAAITLVGCCLTSDRLSAFAMLNAPTRAVLAITNVTIFGQDAVMFLKEGGRGIALTRDFRLMEPQLWTFLLVPQAWSLGVELFFYLVAPFVLRGVERTAAICAVSLALTVAGWRLGLDGDPWTYRFFPFELSLFLLGALAERMILPRTRQWSQTVLRLAPAAAGVVILLFGWLPVPEPLASIVELGLLCLLLPLLFRFQHGRRWDTAIGNLSYPLYIGHFGVMQLVGLGLPEHHLPYDLVAVAASVAAAVLLEQVVVGPVERLRWRIRAEPGVTPPPGTAPYTAGDGPRPPGDHEAAASSFSPSVKAEGPGPG